MKISAFASICMICLASTNFVSAISILVVNRNGEDSLETININIPETTHRETTLRMLPLRSRLPSFPPSRDMRVTTSLRREILLRKSVFSKVSPFISSKKNSETNDESPPVAASILPFFGFDPIDTLTSVEKKNLEETIQDAFHKIHQDRGTDHLTISAIEAAEHEHGTTNDEMTKEDGTRNSTTSKGYQTSPKTFSSRTRKKQEDWSKPEFIQRNLIFSD